MAIVPMQKVAVLAHRSLQEDVLDFLHRESVLQIAEGEIGEVPDHTDIRSREGDVEYAIEQLLPLAGKSTKKALRKPATEQDIILAAQHTDVRGIVEQLRQWEKEETDAQRQIQESKALLEQLTPWKMLSYRLDEAVETRYVTRFSGTLPSNLLPSLRKTCKEHEVLMEIEHIKTENKTAFLTVHVWKEQSKQFEELATTLGWTEVQFPVLPARPTDILEEQKVNLEQLRTQQKERQQKSKALAAELPGLIKARQYFRWLDDKQHAREALAETAQTVTLFGWVPRSAVRILEAKLQKISPATALLRIKADPDEEPPVLLHHPKWIAPFRSVTNLYGLPLPSERDPTFPLAPFFILFFALCLTDAGYGVVLAIVFGVTLLRIQKTVEEAPLLWLLFFGGIATILVGIPFGGWWGLNPEQIPAGLTYITKDGSRLFLGQVWNLSAQSGVTFLQNLSIALGLAHLSFGMLLSGMQKWVHGRKVEALWMDFTSHLLIGAGLFAYFAPEHLQQLILPIVYVSLAFAIWGKGYGSPWYLRPVMGTLGVLNFTISMLSNTLSYLRILALGLVTGALAMAMNMVAVQIGNLFPLALAIPLTVLIFIGGHLVSIALNTLGSFIHSGRLQFIEFFSQFFEGGGRAFSPFRRSLSS